MHIYSSSGSNRWIPRLITAATWAAVMVWTAVLATLLERSGASLESIFTLGGMFVLFGGLFVFTFFVSCLWNIIGVPFSLNVRGRLERLRWSDEADGLNFRTAGLLQAGNRTYLLPSNARNFQGQLSPGQTLSLKVGPFWEVESLQVVDH